jgi:two-component SAPR family response regulator
MQRCVKLEAMEYKEAIEVLKSLLKKHPLDEKEKEAVMTAIGVLSWGGLYESKLKDRKTRRDKSAVW